MHSNKLRSGLNIPIVVLSRRQESFDCQSVIFARPRNFDYSSGHWMDIAFTAHDIPDVKTFSFASSPTEPDLMISFRNGVTKYKRALSAICPGDTMTIKQYGGLFTYNPGKASIMIAGGIGIAPIRSMLKEASDRSQDINSVIIFANATNDFPFKRELDSLVTAVPSLKVYYLNTKTEGKLTAKLLLKISADITSRLAYVAGPPSMVAHSISLLRNLGLNDNNIQMDSFTGY